MHSTGSAPGGMANTLAWLRNTRGRLKYRFVGLGWEGKEPSLAVEENKWMCGRIVIHLFSL